jgi:HD-GYP domain-containing protein (c-di-GMP phosphodiesterase class II)
MDSSAAAKPKSDVQPFRRRGRIVLSLLAVLAFVGLVPLASVAWKLIDINREALTTAQQEYQLLLAQSVAKEVDIHVEGLRNRTMRMAQGLESVRVRNGKLESGAVRRTLEDVEGEDFLYVRYTDLKGNVVASRATGQLLPELESLFTRGLRDAAEILARKSMQRPGSAHLSRPLVLEGPRPEAVLVISTPVVASGRFCGVVSGLVDFESVWDSVVRRNRTGHTVFALDTSGNLFAVGGAPGPLGSERDLSGSGIVQRFLTAKGRARETMPFVWNVNGVETPYLGSYEVTSEGWGIFVQAMEGQVYLPVRRMMQSTMSWALAALSLAILVAVVFAGTLSKPINRLAAASRAFAAGEFSERVEVRSRNEIGELADTFNRMADEIEDHIQRLKKAAEENNELFMGTIRVMANAIDAKDPYTRGHSVRVNRYAVIIARYMGLPRQEIDSIHVASVLHDVGKIGINDSILQKPGGLTPDEYDVMKTHAARGAHIMAPIRQMQGVIPGLRSHHERWNGSGYPDRLAGEDIPLMGRIIAVADTFDAMTTDRPYQKAFTFQQAVDRINDLKVEAFDERVVEAFNRAYQAGEFGSTPDTGEVPRSAAV